MNCLKPEISNTVITFNMIIKTMNVIDIARNNYNIIYGSNFGRKKGNNVKNSVQIRIKYPPASVVIYKSGKAVVRGLHNPDNLIIIIRKIIRCMNRAKIKVYGIQNVNIENIVATFRYKEWSLHSLYNYLLTISDDVKYESELFPGISFRISVDVPMDNRNYDMICNSKEAVVGFSQDFINLSPQFICIESLPDLKQIKEFYKFFNGDIDYKITVSLNKKIFGRIKLVAEKYEIKYMFYNFKYYFRLKIDNIKSSNFISTITIFKSGIVNFLGIKNYKQLRYTFEKFSGIADNYHKFLINKK